jgi:hypothetical protein
MSNREKRLEQMGRGMEELRLWLVDTVRQGLGQLEAQGEQAFERLAARMVDAKLGSIGRRVRNWKILLKMADWQEQLLVEMGELFLAVSAFERSDTLSDELTMDLLQFAGLSLRKEEVLAGDPVEGPWGVAGVAEGEEENLRFRRTWLQNQRDGSFALLLDFAWGGQPFEHTWKAGMQYEGSLVYYPSAYPLRALVVEFGKPDMADPLFTGFQYLDELSGQFAQALALQPWLQRFPAVLEQVLPVKSPEGGWSLMDENRQAMALSGPADIGWILLSVGGGRPLNIFGEWNGATFAPLACLSAGKWIVLSPAE